MSTAGVSSTAGETQRVFADVVVFSPAKASEQRPAFTYHLPNELVGRVDIGSLVVVPFRTRRLYGAVVSITDEPPAIDTRPVGSLVDPDPVLTREQIKLARWMRDEYLASLYECLELMLPPGMVGHSDVRIGLAGEANLDAANTDAQTKLLELLKRRGSLTGNQLGAALAGVDWRAASRQLERRGIVTRESFLAAPKARPKLVEHVRLLAEVDLTEALKGLRSHHYPDIVDLLRYERTPVPVSWVYEETGCDRYHLKKLEERGVVAFLEREVWRDPLEGDVFVTTEPPRLTSDQEDVWRTIERAVRRRARPSRARDPGAASGRKRPPGAFLLHGVTGSGKTEVYLRAVDQVLRQGRKAIILVPEISLTPQTVARFAGRFPDRVTVLHSALTDGERYDTWRRAREGLVDVVVGPRSALFVPLSPLGLIILDEEHDDSYKQVAPRPRYHARDAALQLGRLAGATVILGSATPSLVSYHRAVQGELSLQEMPRRVMGHSRRLQELQARHHLATTRYRRLSSESSKARYLSLPPVQVVDLRAELRAGNRSIFSRPLQEALDDALARGEQVILFLNRRGSATHVLCRDCGYVVRCPHCDIPLTYHSHEAHLICHHCNHREAQPERCPQCGGSRIRYFGLGTQKLEDSVRTRWPEARLLRWDRDTARTHEAHSTILERFSSGAADVLVGTQMITKGLDLPLVTVVGVISADTALNLPDFRSSERTFQVLTQVAGRAGRGLLGGRVIIQSYHPHHYAIVAASKHDYEGFAEHELAFRREQGYPPYTRLAKLVFEDEDYYRAESQAQDLSTTLRRALARAGWPTTNLLGPAPPFFGRIRGRYRWQILVRHPDPPAFLSEVDIPPGWHVEVDPVDVL